MSLSVSNKASQAAGPLAAQALASAPLPTMHHFGVVPFRRDASGAIVPGAVVPVPNGDIAWRRARAEAFDHDNVGAVALTGAESLGAGHCAGGVLIALFGEVSLDRLAD